MTEARERKRTRTNDDMPYINDHAGSNGASGVNGVHVDTVDCEHDASDASGRMPNPNPDEWFIGAVDQGTTSSRFIIFSSQADIVAQHQIEFDNHYPESG